MMNVNRLSEQVLNQAEINSLAWQTMTRLTRGETIQINGEYIRLMDVMRKRAEELEAKPILLPIHKNDWLALALFAEDRERFHAACQSARKSNNLLFLRAEPWLRHITD